MINWDLFIARLVGAIGSWLDACNLRNRVFALKDENEILRTALEDIERMDSEGRLGQYAKKTIDSVDELNRIRG
jgi:hypothetical protein